MDVRSLGGDALTEVIAGCERLISWAHANQLAAITALNTRMAALVDTLPDSPGFKIDAGTVSETAKAMEHPARVSPAQPQKSTDMKVPTSVNPTRR